MPLANICLQEELCGNLEEIKFSTVQEESLHLAETLETLFVAINNHFH